MNPMLQLELGDTAHKGAVASQVILGVAVAAGMTPLVADRRARAVKELCDAVSGGLRMEAHADGRSRSVVTIRAARGWDAAPPDLVGALEATVDAEALEFVLARTPLRAS